MTSFAIVLLLIYGLSFVVQMFYYWYFFSSLAYYRETFPETIEYPPISVVIAARNEYHHLVKYLPGILSQDYPDFEVVVVNHASDDESAEYLKEISKKDPRLKVVNIERELNFFRGKKFPLSLGIKSASNEVLLLTDADCVPASNDWIKQMAGSYRDKTEIVLGYGPYIKRPGFTNLLVRYDTFLGAMQYLSYAVKGIPYMGVGRNLSYHRSLFFRNKGFTSHYKISSGDDDLFINQAANGTNTRICISKESFTYSEPVANLKGWLNQKFRHLTTATRYKTRFKILLGAYSFSTLLLWAMLVALLVMNIYPVVVISMFLLRILTQVIVHKKILHHFRDGQLLLFSLLWELFHLLTLHSIALSSLFRKQVQWK